MIKEIKLYAQVSREHLFDKAHRLGLSDEATQYFSHAIEFTITVEVDTDTGAVYPILVK
jgi:hypothetical protein